MADFSDEQILERAQQLITETVVGLFTTVDEAGRPHSRYMTAVPGPDDQQLARLFSLTAHETQKIHDLHENPNVCWTFATPQYHEVVTLKGQASITSTTDLAMSAWNSLIDLTDPYVPAELRDKDHYAYDAITTRIDEVEYLNPSRAWWCRGWCGWVSRTSPASKPTGERCPLPAIRAAHSPAPLWRGRRRRRCGPRRRVAWVCGRSSRACR